MRHATLVLALVLLAACASTPPPASPPPPPGPGAALTLPPLCNSQPNLPAVLISIDPAAPAGSQVGPKTCSVKKNTMITWRASTPFLLVFDKSPEDGDEKVFPSSDPDNDGFQEVTRKAKNVWSHKEYKYDVWVNTTTKLDPTIIIDP